MELKDYQKEKLLDIQKNVSRQFSRVWGVLPPTNDRHDLMLMLKNAEKKIQEMIENSEQKGE